MKTTLTKNNKAKNIKRALSFGLLLLLSSQYTLITMSLSEKCTFDFLDRPFNFLPRLDICQGDRS